MENNSDIRLIVGLGNVGYNYLATRHNVGFLVIEKLCIELGINLKFKKFNGCFYKGNLDKYSVIIAKPGTMMNLSGDFVSKIAKYYKIKTENILIIHDDKDLPFGKIRFSINASAGGHNGVVSIINSLNTKNIKRLRIGIGKPDNDRMLKIYVLQEFEKVEIKELAYILDRSKEGVFDFIEKSFIWLMNNYN